MSIFSNLLSNLSADMSYELNACNSFMFADKLFFEVFDSVAKDVINELNFNKFITNYKLVAHESSSHKSKN